MHARDQDLVGFLGVLLRLLDILQERSCIVLS